MKINLDRIRLRRATKAHCPDAAPALDDLRENYPATVTRARRDLLRAGGVLSQLSDGDLKQLFRYRRDPRILQAVEQVTARILAVLRRPH